MGGNVRTVPMPGGVWTVAATGATGLLLVTSFTSDSTIVLTALDPAGTQLWEHKTDRPLTRPRIHADTAVWIAEGNTVTTLDLARRSTRSVVLEHQPHEDLGAFVVLPDGICAAWLPDTTDEPEPAAQSIRSVLGGAPPPAESAEPPPAMPYGRAPRVARYDDNGATVWSTPILTNALPDCGPTVRATGKRSWLLMSHHQPLLVSGDRVAASYVDIANGIGVTFFLDTTTGDPIATTPPHPSASKAIVAPGEFLIGEQGYGAFATTRYDRRATAVQRWKSHGMLVVDRHGTIHSAEYENMQTSRSRLRGLAADGTLIDGPALPNDGFTYPAVDRDGTVVLWRGATLLAVDTDFRARELFTRPDTTSGPSRPPLLADGQIVFGHDSELVILRDTGIGPLDEGAWPCDDGNLNGNPVAYR
jgi:outer membrane protein assembly factor BamB